MAEEDWDLYAVVRGCKSATTTATGTGFNTPDTTGTATATTQNYLSCLSKLTFEEEDAASSSTFPNTVQPITHCFHELQQACIPFMWGTTTMTNTSSLNGMNISVPTNSSVSDFGGSTARQQQPFAFEGPHLKPRIFHDQQKQPQSHSFQISQCNISSYGVTLSNTPSQTTRSRKRKSQQKRLVCHVPAEKLSSDLWAWRKYGQKPIKGSPYPRNYYRCSSSKGCAARKQVERSTKDPELFVVTYTGEHTHPRPTHRNSLAGSTRPRLASAPQKPDSQSSLSPGSNTVVNNNTNPSSSSPMPVSPTTPITSSPPEDETQSRNMEIEGTSENHGSRDVDDDDLLIPNMVSLADEIFADFNHLDSALPTEHDQRFWPSI